jgi:GTP-binding protein HflX
MAGGASSAAAAVGGIGTRGPGEKQLEIDRRLVKKRLSMLRRQIGEIDRRKQRQVRSRQGFVQVCLVGYTNAGKSTLMNALAGAGAYVEDKLFATLDTKTARWNLGQELGVLLSDTVGFVRDLPHHLVASFRATLEEAIHADLLLHVVDASNPAAEMQFEAAKRVLEEIGCEDKKTVLVLNKVDRAGARMMSDTLKTLYPEAVVVSAKSGLGLEVLAARVREQVTGEIVHVRVRYAAGDGRIGHFLRAYGRVVEERFEDSTAVVEAHVGRKQLHGLGQFGEADFEVLPPRGNPKS